MNQRRLIRKTALDGARAPKRLASNCSGSSIFSGRAWNALARNLWLSRRELQIVRGVFDGLTEFAIAANLNISTRTVRVHLERLQRKLGVTDRVALAVRVVEEFLKLTTLPGSVMTPICALRVVGRCPLQQPGESTQLAYPLPAPAPKRRPRPFSLARRRKMG
jgi:DNA-binding CsgD family transcriptional regulator